MKEITVDVMKKFMGFKDDEWPSIFTLNDYTKLLEQIVEDVPEEYKDKLEIGFFPNIFGNICTQIWYTRPPTEDEKIIREQKELQERLGTNN